MYDTVVLFTSNGESWSLNEKGVCMYEQSVVIKNNDNNDDDDDNADDHAEGVTRSLKRKQKGFTFITFN